MDIETFRSLLTPEGQQLLASLPPYDERTSLAVAERLRRDHPAEMVAAALTQARLRARAQSKFGELARRLYFTREGLEQATRLTVAQHRARRYANVGSHRVADLCWGIGGDLLALALAGPAELLGVDRNPLTCAIAEANAAALGFAKRVRVRCEDVTVTNLHTFDAVFADPSRRTPRGRVFDPEAYSPPLAFVAGIANRVPAAAVKVAPGIPREAVPDGAEAEWVSDGGDVVEAVLWFGPLASGVRRRATLLPSGEALVSRSSAGAPPAIPVGPPRRWLYEPDGAVIRAGLVADVAELAGGTLLDPMIAYVTSDTLVATPFATAYEVTDVLPFQLKRLRAILRDRGVGTVTVKKRGSAVEPEQLRRQLRLDGPASAVIVLTRVGGAPTALLCSERPATGR